MGAIRVFVVSAFILAAFSPVAAAQAQVQDDRSCAITPLSIISVCEFRCEAGDLVEVFSLGPLPHASARCGDAFAVCDGVGVCEHRSENASVGEAFGACQGYGAFYTECRAVRAA